MPGVAPKVDWLLAAYNSLGVCSTADYGVIANSESEAIAAADWALERGLPVTLLGGGSNVLLRPRLRGLVVIMACRGRAVTSQGSQAVVTASAGENWHSLVRFSIGQGLNGLQNLALIPGSVGAAPIQNIGAYGVELAERFVDLQAYDLQERERLTLSAADCCFGYRDSLFKQGRGDRFLILSLRLRLYTHREVEPEAQRYAAINRELENMGTWRPTPAGIAEAVCRVRRRKLPDPAQLGNVGSVFKNPVVTTAEAAALNSQVPDLVSHAQPGGVRLAAAQLIDLAGCKTLTDEGAALWQRQPLVLIQRQKTPPPTVRPFRRLLAAVRERVRAEFGVQLETEPRELGFDPESD